MRISKFKKTFEMLYGDTKFTLDEQVEYVLSDVFIIAIIKQGLQEIIESDVDFYKDERIKSKIYNGESLYNKSIITFRNGGIGDLLFQLPAIQKIKEIYKDNVKITLCCNSQYIDLFTPIPYIESVSLPLTVEKLLEHDYYVNFEGLIETDKRAETVNAYELHNEKFFVKPDVMIPKLFTDEENDKIILKELDNRKNNIVIAFQSSAYIRSVNPEVYANLIAYMGKTYPEFRFYIVGTKNTVNEIDNFIKEIKTQAKVYNCINFSKKYSELGKVMSLIKNSQCVIGPDSGLIHIAGALNIPLIGLYGPFHSSLRISTYKNSIGIDSMSNCRYAKKSKLQSCFQHGGGSCTSAIKNDVLYSPCMELIRPDMIVKELKTLKIIS